MKRTDAEMVMRLVGMKILMRRKRLNLTQTELASMLIISRPSLVNIEKGRQPVTILRLVEIADALECDLKDLLPKIR